MMRALLQRIARRLPLKPISHEGGLYLKRYYVGTWCGVRCYLHHFLLDDPDGLHNHPWKYGLSVLLAGWYWEERRWGRRKVKWINVVNGDCLHRVLLPSVAGWHGKFTVWSLFFHTARVCDWAFVRIEHRGSKGGFYDKVLGTDNPTPFSDWWKTAPTGAEWEAEQRWKTISYKADPEGQAMIDALDAAKNMADEVTGLHKPKD